jgi:hypothetical protein
VQSNSEGPSTFFYVDQIETRTKVEKKICAIEQSTGGMVKNKDLTPVFAIFRDQCVSPAKALLHFSLLR